jgi:hypothetical protein
LRLGTITDSVKCTEDCERSTKYHPGLKISKEDLKDKVRKLLVKDAWFKNIEKQEMTLCSLWLKVFLCLEIGVLMPDFLSLTARPMHNRLS